MWAIVGGLVATVLGVILGAILTNRSQDSSWTRDRQLEAYSAIIRESTRAQLQLRNQLKQRVPRVDWMPWNEALALIGLLGTPELVRLAQAMDRAFWQASSAVNSGKPVSEESWIRLREPLEATRLAFLNAARRTISKDAVVIERLVSRIPLKEVRAQIAELSSE